MRGFLMVSVVVASLFLVGHHQSDAQQCYKIDTSRPEWLGTPFVRGDATADSVIDLFDGLRVIYWLGGQADEPPCVNAADAEDDEDIDIFDGLRIIYWIGGSADQPPPPCCVPPEDCGVDPSPGDLTCIIYPPCGEPKGTVALRTTGRAEASRIVIERAVAEGRTVVVPVTLINAEPLVGFTFVVEYDPGVLAVTAVDNADMVTEGFDIFVGGVREPGLVKVVGISDMEVRDGVEKLPVGEHRVARLLFKVSGGSLSRDVSLLVANSAMAVSHDRALNHRRVDGLITAKSLLPNELRINR